MEPRDPLACAVSASGARVYRRPVSRGKGPIDMSALVHIPNCFRFGTEVWFSALTVLFHINFQSRNYI